MASRRDASAARERLRALTQTAYAAAAGHLEVDPPVDEAVPARRRWGLAPRASAAALVLLVGLAGFSGARAVASRGADPVPVEAAEGWSNAHDALGADLEATATPAPAGGAGSGEDEESHVVVHVVVHVAGQVIAPGIVDLPAGSRVHEAIAAAGGASAEADLDAVNLARVLVDGEQVYVPQPGEAVPVAARGSAAVGLVDLNAADLADLDALPGIGPVLAQRILDWRSEHGRFTSVEELGEVSGIGPTLLAKIRDLVTA